ncbi:calmodulin-beta-like isoform X3 [Dreissena polymorpha]|uniref:calmodulin-beta-like isoform X3 n=1 Tax=Dreissena polymorpha TaxID=45954 RepID=UPI002263D877|nr:calmodulin-beta-like isoform X3 [Dreissena polymorpha]
MSSKYSLVGLTAVDALTDEDREELSQTFKLFDRDGDGFLTARELGDAMRAMAQHPTEQEIQELIKRPEGAADEGPHLTDFDAFLHIMAKRMTVPEPDDQLLEAFRVFDKEGTGIISAADLRQIVTTMGERLTDEEVEEMIKEADDDGDGQINYQEFTQMLISN